MTVRDLDEIPIETLLPRTLESARAEPVLRSDDYWAHVRALHFRAWATFALGAVSEEDSSAFRDALAANLTDADDEVRGEAIAGLAKRRDGRAVQPILSELEQLNVIGLAIEAAEAMPHFEFLPQLERLQTANPDDEDIQRAVVRCRDASSRNANDQSDA